MDFGKPLETGEPVKYLPSENSGGMSSPPAVANAVMEHGQIIPCQNEGGRSVQAVLDLARPDPEKLNLEAYEGAEGDAKKPSLSSSSSNMCMDASSPGEALGICQNENCRKEILALRRQNEEMKAQMKEKDWMIAKYVSFYEKVGNVLAEEEQAFQAFDATESEALFGASPAKISRTGN